MARKFRPIKKFKQLRLPLQVAVALVVAAFIGSTVYAGLGGFTDPPPEATINNGLVGWWKLDGNMDDSSANGYNAVAGGTPTLTADRKGNLNKAYAFDGADWIDTNVDTAANSLHAISSFSWSTSVWFKGSTNVILGRGGGTGSSATYALYVSGGTMATRLKGAQTVIGSGYGDGNWHHVVITWDGSDALAYVDGQAPVTLSVGGVALQTGYDLIIGASANGSSTRFIGDIDDVRVFDRAIDVGEVEYLYKGYGSSGASGRIQIADTQKGLVAHYKFDGNEKDSAPNAHNGTLVGAPGYVPDRHGQANKALGISTGTQRLDNVGIDIGNDWSVSVWSPYPNNGLEETGHWRTLTRGNGGDHQIIVQTGTYALGTYDNTGGTNFRACTPTFNVNSLSTGWHHFAVTQTGGTTGTMTFYVDGEQVCTISGYGSTTDIRVIGNFQSNGQEWGTMDDFRVYDRAISATEVKMLHDTYDATVSISDLQKGLVGYWPFNGNGKDSTPVGNNGTVTGATLTTDRRGRANSAYNFTSSTDYITFPDPSVSTNATISGWFYYISGGAAFFRDNTCSGGWLLWDNGGNLSLRIAGTQYNTGISTPTGAWTHYAVTKNGANVVFYINGAQAYSGGGAANTASVSPWNLMRNGSCAGGPTGMVDDFRIYNRALSQPEVQRLYETYQ